MTTVVINRSTTAAAAAPPANSGSSPLPTSYTSALMSNFTSPTVTSVGALTSWEALKSEGWKLDAEIEAKFGHVESAVHHIQDQSALDSFLIHMKDVQALIVKFRGLVQRMEDWTSSGPNGGPPSGCTETRMSSIRAQIGIFESSIGEKQISLRRMDQEAQRRKEKISLLSKVQTSIDIYGRGDATEMRHLAAEQESLQYTQKQTREILEQAAINREKLSSQRARFNAMGDKLTQLAEQIPIIKDLLKRIDAKRRKDAVVLATVIAICLFLTFLFW